MTNREAFATTLAMLGATFDRKLAPEAVQAYWLVLGELSDADFAVVTGRALMECKFMPAPAELLAFAGHAPPGVASRALEAWGVVRGCVDRLDYTESVDFGPLVNAVLWNMGGWRRLCDLGLTDLNVWAKKDFERVYTEFASRPPATLRGEPHMGFLSKRPRRIAIGGELPLQQLESAGGGEISDIVRAIANAKSKP